MPVTEQIHAPQLVNALGHAAGAVLFAIFAFLLSKDRIGSRLDSSRQAIAAALLALVWNAASLAEAGAAGTARCRAGQSARVVGRHGSCRCEAGS